MRRLFIVPLMVLSTSVVASDKAIFSFSGDNDAFFQQDEDYSNGLFFSYTSPRLHQPTLPLSLTYWGTDSIDKFDITLGQKIYTPSDIKSDTALADDRPYAGYLYLESSYLSLSPDYAQRINLAFGTTGENSFAEEVQKNVHNGISASDPKGWKYQIDNQFIASLGYVAHNSIDRAAFTLSTEWELSSIYEANISNFRSDASTGVMFRIGTNLSNSMGAANINDEHAFRPGMISSSESAWFLYAGAKARYRFNDITIEGDRSGLPHPSSDYDVTLDNTQFNAVIGATWYSSNFGITLSSSIKTPDYKEADKSVYSTGGLNLFTFF